MLLVRTVIATFFIAGSCFAHENSPSNPDPEPSRATSRSQPVTLSLETRTVENDGAFGLHIVRPILHDGTSGLLVEAYGFEGEGEFGMAGGGIVYRRATGSRGAFEASAFFEGLRSTDAFSYPQLGAGIAFSPDKWLTLRTNGYLPLRSKDRRHDATDRWIETEGSRVKQREVSFSRDRFFERAPMRGFDVEAELRLPEPPRWLDPRLAVGYAYREAEDRPDVYAGPTVRAELHFAKHWVAEAEWRNDAHGADQEWRVGVRFQILFGGSAGKDEGRASERYLPVKRFPWPTLSRGVVKGKPQRGESRSLAPATSQQPQQRTAPVDCCPSGNDPLIFE